MMWMCVSSLLTPFDDRVEYRSKPVEVQDRRQHTTTLVRPLQGFVPHAGPWAGSALQGGFRPPRTSNLNALIAPICSHHLHPTVRCLQRLVEGVIGSVLASQTTPSYVATRCAPATPSAALRAAQCVGRRLGALDAACRPEPGWMTAANWRDTARAIEEPEFPSRNLMKGYDRSQPTLVSTRLLCCPRCQGRIPSQHVTNLRSGPWFAVVGS